MASFDPMWAHKGDLSPRRSNAYRLVFLANQTGLGKVVEFDRPHLTHAIEYALADAYRRDVEIWENGDFVCVVQGDQAVAVCSEGSMRK